MDDSNLFIEWVMDTLQHEHSPSAGDTFPSLRNPASPNDTAPAETPAQDGHRDTNSWSSGDIDSCSDPFASVMEHDGWSWSPPLVQCAPSRSTNHRPVSWNFTSALAQPCEEATLKPKPTTAPSRAHDGDSMPFGSAPPRRASARAAASTGHTALAACPQEHIMAERKRREKINRRFIELSTAIPGLKKMDKATILSDALRYVKELQEKLKALENHNGRSIEPAALLKIPCIAPPDYKDGCAAAVPGTAAVSAGTTRNSLPEIEVRISEEDVVVRIHCENAKGLLVRLLAEVEALHLDLTHANVIPFPSCTMMIITVMAKIEDGFNVAAENIVGRLYSVLHQHNMNNTSGI